MDVGSRKMGRRSTEGGGMGKGLGGASEKAKIQWFSSRECRISLIDDKKEKLALW